MATIQLACDDCGAQRQGTPNQGLSGLRFALSKVGWKTDTKDADLCPTCVGKRLLKAGQSGGAAS